MDTLYIAVLKVHFFIRIREQLYFLFHFMPCFVLSFTPIGYAWCPRVLRQYVRSAVADLGGDGPPTSLNITCI